MIKRNRVIIGSLAAIMSTLCIFGDNLLSAKADPYHEMVEYNEIKILDSELPQEAEDNQGNQWKYYKYEDGTVCLFGLKNPKENIIIPSNNIIIILIDSQYEKLIIDSYAKTKISE